MKKLLFVLLCVAFAVCFVECKKEGFDIGEIKSTWRASHHQDGPEEDGVLLILKVNCKCI